MADHFALPHHDGSELYARTTTHDGRTEHHVRVRVPRDLTVTAVHIRYVADAEPRFAAMEAERLESVTHDSVWWAGSFELVNPVTGYRFLVTLEDGRSWWLCSDGVDTIEPRDARDFRISTWSGAPEWAPSQVMYQIFPDRFARSARADERSVPEWGIAARWTDDVAAAGGEMAAQFYGGDLDGIVERLDHLRTLGVTLLYLTPFFPGWSNHRYDASTFDHVDPLLGGDAALIRLTEAAHARGMRVIGDLTTNHTGVGHEWFRAAWGSPDAVESEFYYWLDERHTEYVAWYGVPSLPKLDWSSSELRRRFIEGPDSVVARWLQAPYHLDGWRIDVANMTGRLGAHDHNRDVQRTIRRTMDEVAPGSVLYAESTNDATADFDGRGWDAPMSYSAFTRPVWQWLRDAAPDPAHHFGIPYAIEPRYSADDVVASYRRFAGSLPWSVQRLALNAINTHDTPRFAERADDDRQLVAFGLSVALPGTPVVFAGDEFGLAAEHGERSRTPMPWGEEPRLERGYAGFITARTQLRVLQQGGVRWLYSDEHCMVFVRETSDAVAVIFAADGPARAVLPRAAVGELPELSAGVGTVAVAYHGEVTVLDASGPSLAIWGGAVATPVASADVSGAAHA